MCMSLFGKQESLELVQPKVQKILSHVLMKNCSFRILGNTQIVITSINKCFFASCTLGVSNKCIAQYLLMSQLYMRD